MGSHSSRIMLAAALLFTANVPVVAQSGNTTPYAALYQVLEPAREVAAFDRLQPLQRVESTLSGVGPASIKLTIKSRSGDIPIPIRNGGLVDFPLTDALIAENPPVQSNQPKGSLTLSLSFALKLPDSQSIAWSDLEIALQQARIMIAKQLHTDQPAPVVGAEFHFAVGTDARITLSGKSERLLVAGADGRIIVMADASEKPRLLLSHKPLLVVPYLRP